MLGLVRKNCGCFDEDLLFVKLLWNSPYSLCLEAGQENWVECMKSRLSGKFPGETNKQKKKTNKLFFRF